MAQDSGKWILANIQSHLEYFSSLLNQETWSDETVVEVIRSSFLFWQRGHTSRDAQSFMNTYRVTDTDLPHISIIDPRTGSRLLTLKVVKLFDMSILC